MDKETQKLLEKYPFIQAYRWDDTPIDGHTVLGGMPDGWRKAFAIPMLEDFAKAIDQDGLDPKELRVIDVKEKYGELRWYWCAKKESPNLDRITTLYECVASAFCANCGRYPVMMTTGYILPLCEECWKEHEVASICDDGKTFEQEFPEVTCTRTENGHDVTETLPLKELFERIIHHE